MGQEIPGENRRSSCICLEKSSTEHEVVLEKSSTLPAIGNLSSRCLSQRHPTLHPDQKGDHLPSIDILTSKYQSRTNPTLDAKGQDLPIMGTLTSRCAHQDHPALQTDGRGQILPPIDVCYSRYLRETHPTLDVNEKGQFLPQIDVLASRAVYKANPTLDTEQFGIVESNLQIVSLLGQTNLFEKSAPRKNKNMVKRHQQQEKFPSKVSEESLPQKCQSYLYKEFCTGLEPSTGSSSRISSVYQDQYSQICPKHPQWDYKQSGSYIEYLHSEEASRYNLTPEIEAKFQEFMDDMNSDMFKRSNKKRDRTETPLVSAFCRL